MEDGDGPHLATIDWSSVYHLRFADSILGQLFSSSPPDSFLHKIIFSYYCACGCCSFFCIFSLHVDVDGSLTNACCFAFYVSPPPISYCTCGSSWLFCITASSFASSYVSACFVDDQSAFLACLHLQNMEFL